MDAAFFTGLGKPQSTDGEVKREEPESEPFCSPVLRSDGVTTGIAEGPGAERRGAPPGPGLPCLSSNNSNGDCAGGVVKEVSEDRPEARLLLRLNLLTGGHKR